MLPYNPELDRELMEHVAERNAYCQLIFNPQLSMADEVPVNKESIEAILSQGRIRPRYERRTRELLNSESCPRFLEEIRKQDSKMLLMYQGGESHSCQE
ncbi:hypothetical protein HY496_01525 [Candidatus Woesearchaeota archaeon]|nr:hypothetical protein [Candidatus Woesearchaeota archaeon]